MSENSESATIPNLVTPNTEKAVQDIIKHSLQQQQLQQQNQPDTIKEETTKEETSSSATPSATAGASTISSNEAAVVHHQPPPAPAPTSRIPAPPGDDNFENLQRAVKILGQAKHLDEAKRFDEALKLYRQGVDMLLEELIVRQGTEQSRSYLRDKCNDFMNRIDQLKLIIQIEKASADNKENSKIQ